MGSDNWALNRELLIAQDQKIDVWKDNVKKTFPVKISIVNVNKSADNWGFVHIY